MKKLLTLLLVLFFPTQAAAWESTIGLGYDHRHFDSNDQLGAVSPDKKLSPTYSSGLRLGGSIIWDIRDNYKIGPEIWISHGWLSVPHQIGYFAKTVGTIDTNDLTVQTVSVSAKSQILEGGGYRLFLKPGFLVTNLTSGFADSVDTDTGASLGIELAGDIGKHSRFFVDVQTLLSPSTERHGRFVLSSNLVLGLQWIFASKDAVAVQEPVKVSEIQKPEELPKSSTLESPSVPVVQVAPIIVKPSEPQKVKGTLKLGQDGKLDPESFPLIQKIIDSHSKSPSIVKIIHKKDSASQTLAEAIKNYIISKGCPKEEITVESSDSLEKPIKITIISK